MDIIIFALNAVMPLVLLIALGYFLKRINFINENFITIGNKIVFKVALPVALFLNIYKGSLASIDWSIILYSVLVIILLFIIGLASVLIFTKDPRKKGVILQDIFRSNYAVIGTPLVIFIANGNSDAIAISALVAAFTIPVFNILAVVSLTIFIKDESGKGISLKELLLKIVKNPLIIGVFLGIIVLLIRPLFNGFTIKNDLKFVYTAFDQLGSLSSPLSLIVLGAGFTFGDVRPMLKHIIHGCLYRNLIGPFIGLGLAVLLIKTGVLHFGAEAFPSLIALFGAPAAVSSAIMAYEMNNDEKLAGQLVVWTAIMSVFTIFFSIVVLKNINLL
ncbi:Transporter, auxin efflux carrier (AEC) family protein [Alteracholeplasma palmae J233]|uniref:Transporter, auxin efflux carrier (AEC) family protein n=1 Tax=Alteracholeplasma palmae (strain ATCC 49389 / J233) TaxID=1318466 RepID=U4KL49_ALTPJ|nr:AEC family transporter [Alteracholeplasma palmae]CCV64482.1 Transporter, auxin efflux carrier (AEC) family protein [Alteracholeplasma palmae J233]